VDLLGDLHGPRVGAVGHDDVSRPVADQVPRGKLRHLAGAHEQHRPAFQAPQDLLRHLHGGEAHRDGVARDGRLRPHALGRAEGMVEQLVEDDPRGLLFHAAPVGVLDLPEDLGLAHDHGVQARGDPEEVAHGVAAAVDVEALLQLFGGEVAVAQDEGLHPGDGVFHVLGAGEDLDPVARREVEGLLDGRRLEEFLERSRAVAAGKGETLPDLQRRRLVVHADEDDVHMKNHFPSPFGIPRPPEGEGRVEGDNSCFLT